MKRCRSNGLCCGAGGAQMFKEEEKGDKRINWERTDEAIETGASIIAAACPFCNTMLTDGVKTREKGRIYRCSWILLNWLPHRWNEFNKHILYSPFY